MSSLLEVYRWIENSMELSEDWTSIFYREHLSVGALDRGG